MLIGLLACFGACLLLGTLFVPIKSCPPTDGFSTQLFMCLAGYLSSFVIYAFMEFPGLYGIAMIGGAIWSATNCFAVQIMVHVGMAMFMLFASSISCLTGWAISRFGLFGVPSSIPMSNLLNYIGIALLISGLRLYQYSQRTKKFFRSVIYPFIKINVLRAVKTVDLHVKVVPMARELLKISSKSFNFQSRLSEEKTERPKREDVDMNSSVMKVAAWIGTILVGLSLGVMTTPVTLLMTRHDLYPLSTEITSSVSFHFSFFTGVILVSISIFIIYCLAKKGRPIIPPKIVIPSMLSGLFFSVAMLFFFIANEKLSPTISYPICMMAPGLVTSAWSVFYFKEISVNNSRLE
uniref:Transmembrane protein 144 n=1 Tax=Caenorhabditis tropicalis TaxID=1561998 RepID=A0A1I7U8D7_9PELO